MERKEKYMKHEYKATLKEHQAVLYKLLQTFDGVCKKHNIKYMLFAGTALGAVRHQGFIPWDDDLDVVMLRTEYERFLSVAEQELDKDTYCVQKEFTEHWPMFFSKLRMQGTTCLERYIPKDPLTNLGIYIDIFPCDNLSDSKLVARLQFLASKIVIAKCLTKKGYITYSSIKKVFMALCKLLPFELFKKLAMKRKAANSKYVHSFFAASRSFRKSVYPREWFTETKQLSFEGADYPVSAYYDDLLKVLYGDYMTLPSAEDRKCKIHAVLVDFDNSYERYIGIQKNMDFEELTKSIR